MKTALLLISFIFFTSLKAQDTTYSTGKTHGGVLKTVGDYKIEVLNSYKSVTVYISDKNNKKIANKDIEGMVSFYYTHDASLDKKLIATDEDCFIAEVSNLNYYYCVVRLSIRGKAVWAKFFNISGIAEKTNGLRKEK